jgi:hypothetical protein
VNVACHLSLLLSVWMMGARQRQPARAGCRQSILPRSA